MSTINSRRLPGQPWHPRNSAYAEPGAYHLVYAASYSSFGVYLLHWLILAGAVALYQPVLWWSSLLYLLCLWVPITFVAGWVFQWAADRVVPAISPPHRSPATTP
jgi:hypothetical protein